MAAPEFTLFVKPYLEGWANGEEGGTPMTAEILNDNYDAFLLALNEWAASVGLILESAVTDSNYVHTDNNYTTTEKNKLSGLVAVEANPSGSASTSLLKISINGTIYSIDPGSDVEGNPVDPATVVLTKIKIGNTVYSIPEGGGGSLVPTGVTYGFTYTPGNGGLVEVTKYIDGVQDSQGHISYAEISGGGPQTVDVGDVRLSYASSAFKYQIYSKDSAHVLTYDGVNYEEDDLIFEVAWNAVSESITGTITENDVVDALLSDLGDVDISNPSNGQVLAYDSTSGKWINTNASGGTTVIGNPTGTATAVLTKIQIGNDIFSIPGGSSGGSTVSYSQILATGTKIGTITIDGVPTDIYAPAPPTKTSDLTNDSNFVSDASYVHTDNNYTTTEKNKLADLNQVEANPSSGTSAGDLTSIEIDGTKYNIPSGGGGGTTVIANPSGSATAGNLNKLQVGNDIYSVPSGGSGNNEITDISTTNYEQLSPLEKINGQVYMVSPDSQVSPSYESSNWHFYSAYSSSYKAEIENNKIAFKALDGGGTYNDYADATYKVSLSGVDHIEVIVNITGISTDREIQIGITDTLPGAYSSPTFNPSESLPVSSSWTFPVNKSISIDTSELTGNYYFGIKANGKCRFTVESLLFYYDTGDVPNEIYHMNKKFAQYPNGGSGGSGHTILNDAGTALSQEDDLQFKGAYSHDDSTNGKTVVEVTRAMTLAQYQALSDDEKKGVIAVTDDSPAPYFTDVVGTLAAGATSITLSDASITLNSTIDLFTDTYGVNPSAISVAAGSITLTFAAQQAAVNVKVRVS